MTVLPPSPLVLPAASGHTIPTPLACPGGDPLTLEAVTETTLTALARDMWGRRDAFHAVTDDDLMAGVARAVHKFTDATSPEYHDAYHWLARTTGFSLEVIAEGLAQLFTPITTKALQAILDEDSVEFSPPELTVQILAGALPPVPVVAIIRGVLLRTPQIIKAPSRSPVWPAMFARALIDELPALEPALAVVWYSSREPSAAALQQALTQSASCIVAYGDDATVESIRAAAPQNCSVIDYGHRASIVALTAEGMQGSSTQAVADAIAYDAALYDQQGCLSPQWVCVAGMDAARECASALATSLETIQARLPRGFLSMSAHVAVRQARGAAAAQGATVAMSPLSTAWTVACRTTRQSPPPVGDRFIHVIAYDASEDLAELFAPWARHIQAIGVAPGDENNAAIGALAQSLGAHRVCRVGTMQTPPPLWLEDDRFTRRAFAR